MMVPLKEIDKLELTVLVDNYSDLFLLENTAVVKRPRMPSGGHLPLAEHGLSLIARYESEGMPHMIMMDAGMTPLCLNNNAKAFSVDLSAVEAVILSHGHPDHFGGLPGLMENSSGAKIIVHPHAFLRRRLNIPGTKPRNIPRLEREKLEKQGAVFTETTQAKAFFSDTVLVLGEVERVTDFETGFLWAEADIGGFWEIDPFHDDQGIAFSVKGKGLVVLGGCSHAGIVNTVLYAMRVTGVKKVHSILGGFHLTGPLFESIIGPTISEIKKIAPDYVVPLHCTGWNAINRFAKEMPDQFLLNSVGTKYVF